METEPLPGWPVEPEYEPPVRWNSQRDGYIKIPEQGQQPAQPQVVNHYHAAPVKRGLQPSTVLAWAMASAMVVAVLVAVSVAAVAIAISVCALVVALVIVRSIWNDYVSGKGPR